MLVTRGESDEIFLEIDGSTLNTLRINEPVSRNIMRYYKSVNGRRCVCGRDIKAGLVSEFVMGFVRGRGGALSTKLSRHSLVGAADHGPTLLSGYVGSRSPDFHVQEFP